MVKVITDDFKKYIKQAEQKYNDELNDLLIDMQTEIISFNQADNEK